MARRVREHDWAASPIGPIEAWPPSLRNAVDTMLASLFPGCVVWGPDLVTIYNDAFRPILGAKPEALGRSFGEVWREVWHEIGPITARAFAGEATYIEDHPLTIERHGYPEDAWFTFCYSPIRDETGRVAGFLDTVVETTGKVLTERRHAFLLLLEDRLRNLTSPYDVALVAAESLGRHIAAARAGYAEMDASGRILRVTHDWTNGELPRRTGQTRPLDTFGVGGAAELRAGGVIAIEDCLSDPRTAGDEAAAIWASIGIRALVAAPLVKSGRFVAFFYAHATEPRRWSAAEVELVRDTAERTWAAVERARAEEARRESEERFRTFAEYAPQAIYIVDAVQRSMEYLNPAFEQIWGEPRETLLRDLSRWRDFLHPDDREHVLALQRGFYAGGDPIEAEYRIVRPNGEIRHVRDTAVPILDAEGRVVRAIGIAHDVTAARRAEAAMRASDERLALATAAAKLGVWDVDVPAGTGIHNREFRAMYGLPLDERPISHGEWLKVIHPEDRERMHKAAQAAQAGEAEYSVEFRINRADTGELRWIASRGSLVGGDPASGRMVGICYDVTERRQEQERQMLLAREVDHRAKNVLAVVQSIVRLTRASDPRSFAQAVEGRVSALARAHTLLSRDRWTGANMTEVMREELLAYGGGGRIALDGPELWLKPDAVQSLSMVLHELATNAAKYGALSVPHGRLTVSWRVSHEAGGTRLHVDWLERGGPPVPAPPTRRGFGSTVVTATMRNHLDGDARMIWDEQGLHCEITAPASRLLTTIPSDHPAPVTEGHAAAADGDPDAVLLQGRRVMVVEDEPLLALEIAATLHELGCTLVGPASTLADALRLANAEAAGLDAVVMDVNLRGQASFPIADLLAGHGVAVIYVSGYGTLPQASPTTTGTLPALLRKPLRDGELASALRHVLALRERDRVIEMRGSS